MWQSLSAARCHAAEAKVTVYPTRNRQHVLHANVRDFAVFTIRGLARSQRTATCPPDPPSNGAVCGGVQERRERPESGAQRPLFDIGARDLVSVSPSLSISPEGSACGIVGLEENYLFPEKRSSTPVQPDWTSNAEVDNRSARSCRQK